MINIRILCITGVFLTTHIFAASAASLTTEELSSFSKRLASKDNKVRAAVVQEINQKGVSHPLLINGLSRMLSQKDVPFPLYIVETLVKLDSEIGFSYCTSVLTEEPGDYVKKIHALRILGVSKTPRAQALLLPYLDSDNPAIRAYAASALATADYSLPKATILSILDTASQAQIHSLLTTLAKKGTPYQSLFEELLAHKNATAAENSFNYFVGLADSQGLDTISAILPSIKSQSLKRKAVIYLYIHGKASAEPFIAEYTVATTHTRYNMLREIAALCAGDARALEKCKALLMPIEKELRLRNMLESFGEKDEINRYGK